MMKESRKRKQPFSSVGGRADRKKQKFHQFGGITINGDYDRTERNVALKSTDQFGAYFLKKDFIFMVRELKILESLISPVYPGAVQYSTIDFYKDTEDNHDDDVIDQMMNKGLFLLTHSLKIISSSEIDDAKFWPKNIPRVYIEEYMDHVWNILSYIHNPETNMVSKITRFMDNKKDKIRFDREYMKQWLDPETYQSRWNEIRDVFRIESLIQQLYHDRVLIEDNKRSFEKPLFLVNAYVLPLYTGVKTWVNKIHGKEVVADHHHPAVKEKFEFVVSTYSYWMYLFYHRPDIMQITRHDVKKIKKESKLNYYTGFTFLAVFTRYISIIEFFRYVQNLYNSLYSVFFKKEFQLLCRLKKVKHCELFDKYKTIEKPKFNEINQHLDWSAFGYEIHTILRSKYDEKKNFLSDPANKARIQQVEQELLNEQGLSFPWSSSSTPPLPPSEEKIDVSEIDNKTSSAVSSSTFVNQKDKKDVVKVNEIEIDDDGAQTDNETSSVGSSSDIQKDKKNVVEVNDINIDDADSQTDNETSSVVSSSFDSALVASANQDEKRDFNKELDEIQIDVVDDAQQPNQYSSSLPDLQDKSVFYRSVVETFSNEFQDYNQFSFYHKNVPKETDSSKFMEMITIDLQSKGNMVLVFDPESYPVVLMKMSSNNKELSELQSKFRSSVLNESNLSKYTSSSNVTQDSTPQNWMLFDLDLYRDDAPEVYKMVNRIS